MWAKLSNRSSVVNDLTHTSTTSNAPNQPPPGIRCEFVGTLATVTREVVSDIREFAPETVEFGRWRRSEFDEWNAIDDRSTRVPARTVGVG